MIATYPINIIFKKYHEKHGKICQNQLHLREMLRKGWFWPFADFGQIYLKKLHSHIFPARVNKFTKTTIINNPFNNRQGSSNNVRSGWPLHLCSLHYTRFWYLFYVIVFLLTQVSFLKSLTISQIRSFRY